MRFINNNFLVSYLNKEYSHYPVYINLSYWWNFGALSFFFFISQLVTGILLAMYYVPSTDLAFISCEHIMRDINYGWVIRYVHANGASFFFLMVYIHIASGLYWFSYLPPSHLVWVVGVCIFLCMIITAFLGYVLPWGQMSFWAATVITNLVTAVPVFGYEIVIWLWGGYSVDNATLNRFLSLHYLLPFVLFFLIILHVIFLHDNGSSNPLAVFLLKDNIMFNPYYTIKDLYSINIILIFFVLIIGFLPNYLGHSDNYVMANSLVTPPHIVPEWYFLPFYAILRSIPNKLGGIIMLFSAIVILLVLPLFGNLFEFNLRNCFNIELNLWFWCFVCIYIGLGWLGGNPVEYPYLILGQFFTFYYFYFLCGLSLYSLGNLACESIYVWNRSNLLSHNYASRQRQDDQDFIFFLFSFWPFTNKEKNENENENDQKNEKENEKDQKNENENDQKTPQKTPEQEREEYLKKLNESNKRLDQIISDGPIDMIF